MSGVAAILRLGGDSIDALELRPMLSVLRQRGPDSTDWTCEGPVALGITRLDTLPEDGPQPVKLAQITVVADARLDNRIDLCNTLRLSPAVSDTDVVAAAITKWDTQTPEHLEGDFAVISWDGDRLLSFRDRYGVKPLFYASGAGRLLIASEIGALIAHPLIPANPDRRYFLQFLAARKPPTRLTPYERVKRLMPGEMMLVTRGSSISLRYYYRLRINVTNDPLDKVAEQTRNLLDEAVTATSRSHGPIVCDVSGGMDSTSIYATSKAIGLPLHARSIVSDRWPQIDERRYSQQLVGDAPWLRIYSEENPPLTDLSGVAVLFDEPAQDILLGNLRLALDRACPLGGRVALSGHGGDALTAGGFDSIRNAVYSGHLWTAYREARLWADERDRSVLRVLHDAMQRSIIQQSRIPWASRKVAKQARTELRRLRKTLFAVDDGNDSIDAFLLSVQAGLRQKPITAVETRYPFLHRPLVEYALATPNHLKRRGALSKQVMRHAMTRRLPASILSRTDKTPFDLLYSWGFQSQWVAVVALMNSSILVDWGLLSATGLQRLAAEVRDGRTTRLVEAIYIFAIEAWLQNRPSR